jgi:signal transduction histidine kinase/DNA-binding response OmpR family regulator/ligand-binding sensor domain-containing protein
MALKYTLRSDLLLTVILLLILPPAYAQVVKKPVRIINTRDGLPQSFVSGLVQDANGFVWIGTLNGVARYDGIQFKVFRNKLGDTGSISSNVILAVSRDVHNNIWIEHRAGQLDMIDPVTEKITRVTAAPIFKSRPAGLMRRGWFADHNGNVWIMRRGNGILRYDVRNNQVASFTRSAGDLASDSIRAVMEDRKNRLWILDQAALCRVDTVTGRMVKIKIPFKLDFNNFPGSELEIVCMHERKNGEIMFGDRNRLIFYQPASGKFRSVPLPMQARTGIRVIQAGPYDGNEYFEIMGTVFQFSDQSGIIKVGEIKNPGLWESPSFLVDRSGLIWVGTNAAGIHQIDLATPLFDSKPTIHSFHEDLLRQELKVSLASIAKWPVDGEYFVGSSYFVRSAYDRKGRLWIGLRNSIGHYDPASKKMVMLPALPNVTSPADLTLGLRGISFAPDSTLWTVGDNGLIQFFNSQENKWVTFMDSTVLKKKVGSPFGSADIFADRDKLFLTSSDGMGLLIVDVRSKEIRHITQQSDPKILQENLLLGMAADPVRPDMLWIGSYNGLILLNKDSLESRVFSMEDELPDNIIYSILTDKSGYLWLSTNKGLCRFHPLTHQVETFLSDDGLPGDEFNRFHHLKLPDGRLAFGGTEGWTLFDPNAMKPDTYRPQVAFTNLKINNADAAGPASPTIPPGSLNSPNTLSLPYDQNTLTFEFAGLEFNRPRRLKYRYQLVGYDNDWVQAENVPVAAYTKLPPGRYELRINVSNTTGQWSPHIRALTLEIRPPFWQTWWAHCFYALAVALGVWAYARYLFVRERLRQEVVLKHREAQHLKDLDVMKTKFFSDMTHEFRTPLTLILTPVQRLRPTLNGIDQQRWLSAIERNANQLLRLINQLLDLSKLESGTHQVSEAVGDPVRFLDDLVGSFLHEAESREIALTFMRGQHIGSYWFDPDKLGQIVSNLIANAIKFTPAQGEIRVSLEEAGGVSIQICDTGPGIAEDQLPHIFDRFYQADGTGNQGRQAGSGIGLSIVKEMVELQHGRLSVESPAKHDPHWRTSFTVWLPYRKSKDQVPAPAHVRTETYWTEYNFDSESANTVLSEVTADDKPLILLVEDNAELAEFIKGSLKGLYRVLQASNGAEGLQLAIQRSPDLVLSDVLMPVMDGFEFCNALKSDEQTNHIPVVILTARSSFHDKMEGLSIGADDYLTKPFSIRELQLRVHNLLERQRQLRKKLYAELSSPDQSVGPQGAQPATLQDIFVRKLYTVIENRLSDSTFGVEELAAELGVSRASLHRKAKSVTGLAPGDIIRNYRLKRAAEFLKEGYNSSETAFKTGFDSASYFSKCFREFYKVTPNEFA